MGRPGSQLCYRAAILAPEDLATSGPRAILKGSVDCVGRRLWLSAKEVPRVACAPPSDAVGAYELAPSTMSASEHDVTVPSTSVTVVCCSHRLENDY